MEVYMENQMFMSPPWWPLWLRMPLAQVPHFHDPPPIPNNTTVKCFWDNPSKDNNFGHAPSAGTPCAIANHIEYPMDANDDHHHDCQWLVDLSALWWEIHHTTALFHTLLTNTLLVANNARTLLWNVSSQPMLMTITLEDNDGHWNDKCQHPMDLLAIQ